MTEEFKFGIPAQRVRGGGKKELYSFGPGITVVKNGGHRTSKRIVINPQACELLKLDPWSDQKVSFVFTEDTPIVVNTTAMELPKSQFYKVSAKKDVAGLVIKDSKLWSYLVKTYNLNETINNSFELNGQVAITPPSFRFSLPLTVCTILEAPVEEISIEL